MHSYTHEYKFAQHKVNGEKVSFLLYLGSRCGTVTCPDSRKRAVFPVVKAHNDQTGQMFGTTGQTRIVQK